MIDAPHASEILRRAAGLVDQGWCRRVEARTKYGTPVDLTSPCARRWCLTGALRRAAFDLGYLDLAICGPIPKAVVAAVLKAIGEPVSALLYPWNDDLRRTGEEVSAVLRHAAELAEAEEKVAG